VRVDSAAYENYTIPAHYDSLVAKLIVTAETRDLAIRRMQRALGEYVVQGIRTNIPFHRAALQEESFIRGEYDTRFVERMNEQARRLDMTGTRFVNASGQPDPQHHSTAADMLRLAEALLRDFPDDRTLFAAPRFDFNGLGQTTRNRLLLRDPTVDGLMTGQTPRSGYSMVASSQRGERSMLAVIVGADSERIRGSEAQRLLNLGFTRWEVMRVGGAERQLSSVRVWKGASREVGLVLAGETLLAVPRTRSGPIQPAIESSPVPPSRVSLPALPIIVSAPARPDSRLLPVEPVRRLSRALPVPLMLPAVSSRFSNESPSVQLTRVRTVSVPSPGASTMTSLRLSTK
jgi:hypothetical protein